MPPPTARSASATEPQHNATKGAHLSRSTQHLLYNARQPTQEPAVPMSPYYQALRDALGPRLIVIPGAAAVIHNAAGEVLLQQRPEGGFSLPGGAVEPGEPPALAAVREVHEETGLLVRPLRLLGLFGGAGFRVRYETGDLVDYVVSLFACEITGGTLRCIDGESIGLTFVPPDQVPPLHTEYPHALLHLGAVAQPFLWDEAWLATL